MRERAGALVNKGMKSPKMRAVATAGASYVAERAAQELPPGKARGTVLFGAGLLAADSAAVSIAVSVTSFMAAFGSVETGVGPVGGTIVGVGAAGLAVYDFKVGLEYFARSYENIQSGTDSGDGTIVVQPLQQYKAPIKVEPLEQYKPPEKEEGDTDEWLEKMRREMAARRAERNE